MAKSSRQIISRSTTYPNGQTHEEEVELLTDFSWRNFFSTINFAKIMQKLSKHRSHRIRMLVQYKSSVGVSCFTFRTSRALRPFVEGLGASCIVQGRVRTCFMDGWLTGGGDHVQAVLKRILKVQHPMLQLHVLKLIKSQVPFCGRKWRQCKPRVALLFGRLLSYGFALLRLQLTCRSSRLFI